MGIIKCPANHDAYAFAFFVALGSAGMGLDGVGCAMTSGSGDLNERGQGMEIGVKSAIHANRPCPLHCYVAAKRKCLQRCKAEMSSTRVFCDGLDGFPNRRVDKAVPLPKSEIRSIFLPQLARA